MSVNLGRRASDVDTGKWMDVLRQARVALLKAVTGELIPDDATVELRFDDDLERRLTESLGKIVLKPETIRELVDQLEGAGRVEIKHISGGMREVYRLTPPPEPTK